MSTARESGHLLLSYVRTSYVHTYVRTYADDFILIYVSGLRVNGRTTNGQTNEVEMTSAPSFDRSVRRFIAYPSAFLRTGTLQALSVFVFDTFLLKVDERALPSFLSDAKTEKEQPPFSRSTQSLAF